MNKEIYEQKAEEIYFEQDLENRKSNLTRGRTLLVGNSLGTIELTIRGDGGKHLWVHLSPVEVAEYIEILAAAIGAKVTIEPKKEFFSYRYTTKE